MGSGASTLSVSADQDGDSIAPKRAAVFISHSSQETELRRRIASSVSSGVSLAGYSSSDWDDLLIVTEAFPRDLQTRAELLAQHVDVAVLAIDARFQQCPALIATVSFLKDTRKHVVAGPLSFHSRPSGAVGAICFAFGDWESGLFAAGSPSPDSAPKGMTSLAAGAGEPLTFLTKSEAQSVLASAISEHELDDIVAQEREILATTQSQSRGLLYIFAGSAGECVAATFAALKPLDDPDSPSPPDVQLCAQQLAQDLVMLAQARVAAFVITDESVSSPSYRRLFEAAVRWQKPILPINASKLRFGGWLAMAMAGKLWYQVDLDTSLEQIHTKYSEIPNCACKVDDSCLATDFLLCLAGLLDAPASPQAFKAESHDSEDSREAAAIQVCQERAQIAIGGLSGADSVVALCAKIQALVAVYEDASGSNSEEKEGEAKASLEALGVVMNLAQLEKQRLDNTASASLNPQDLLPEKPKDDLKLTTIRYKVTRLGYKKLPSVLDERGLPLPNLQLDAMFSYQWGSQSTVLDVHQQGQVQNLRAWFDVFGHMQGNVNAAMATAVENVACVVVFLTRDYVKSINCRLEFQYAAACAKPMIFAFLEDPQSLAKELPAWITDVAGTTELSVYPSLIRESEDGATTRSRVLALDFTSEEFRGVAMTTVLFSAIRQLAAARHRGAPRIACDGSLLLYATTSALRHAVVSSEPTDAAHGSSTAATVSYTCSRCGVGFHPEVPSSLDGCRKHSAYYMGGTILAGRWVCCQEQRKDGPGCHTTQHIAESRMWTLDESYGTHTWKPE